ncbi:PAS domain S-box [Candidatus Magnetoovum chiemensis]|nr:PAS domain S-box [Candidatus Magnetoovum chiemensis]
MFKPNIIQKGRAVFLLFLFIILTPLFYIYCQPDMDEIFDAKNNAKAVGYINAAAVCFIILLMLCLLLSKRYDRTFKVLVIGFGMFFCASCVFYVIAVNGDILYLPFVHISRAVSLVFMFYYVVAQFAVSGMNAQSEVRDSLRYTDREIELELYREHLEEVVKERTAELIETNEKLKNEIKSKEEVEITLKKLSRALEQSDDIIFITDKQGIIEYVNPAFERETGYTKEEVVGKNPAFLKYNVQNEEFYEKLWGSILSDTPFRAEFVNRKKDGTKYVEEKTITPVKNSKGEITHFISLGRDVTPRIKVEEAIRESEKNFRFLVENSVDSIYLLDINGKILDVNQVACSILGYERSELLEMNFFKIEITLNSEQYKNKWMSIKQGNFYSYEGLHRRTDGTTYPVDVRFGMFEREKDVMVILAFARDITERKRMEQSILASLKEKEVLLREVHHRVKNNMQIIISLIKLQAEYISDTGTREMFYESRDRIKSMALVHESLHQSKNLSSINAYDYISKLVNNLYYTYGAKMKNISINIDVEHISITIDTAIPVGLIINELLSNALKYAFTDSARGIITVRFCETGMDLFELIIQDNGIGIPKNVDIRNMKTLGLQLVSDLVDGQLGGQIILDRRKGAKFTIRFRQLKYEQRV